MTAMLREARSPISDITFTIKRYKFNFFRIPEEALCCHSFRTKELTDPISLRN